jgi:hypothetical protein
LMSVYLKHTYGRTEETMCLKRVKFMKNKNFETIIVVP